MSASEMASVLESGSEPASSSGLESLSALEKTLASRLASAQTLVMKLQLGAGLEVATASESAWAKALLAWLAAAFPPPSAILALVSPSASASDFRSIPVPTSHQLFRHPRTWPATGWDPVL